MFIFLLTNNGGVVVNSLAVVAKAPRKNIAPGRSTVLSPSSGTNSGKRKGKVGSSGHSLKLWPVPKGQKGLQSFFGGCSSSSSSDLAGPSSDGAGPSSAAESEEWEGNEGEQGSSSQEEEQVEGASESQETNSSVQLLDEDIAQLNSDDSDED